MFLCGCSAEEVISITPDQVISMSISYVHMTRTSAYGYTLEEKDGQVLFSCHYFTDDGEEVVIEEAPVDAKYMDEMRALVEKYGFLNMKYKEPSLMEQQIRDAPMYTLELGWPQIVNDRTYKDYVRLNYFPTGTEEVQKLFWEIAGTDTDGGYHEEGN